MRSVIYTMILITTIKLFQSENWTVSVCTIYPLCWWQDFHLLLPICIRPWFRKLYSYCYGVHTLEACTVVTSYIMIRKFSLDMVFVQPHAQPSKPLHERKKSVSYSFKSQHHHPFLDNVIVDACMQFYKPLCSDTQLVHFVLPSVHLQCIEEASSMKVLTSNVMAAITKHKVSVLKLM